MPQVQQYAWDKAANSNQPLAHAVVLLNSGGDATQTAAILSRLTAEQSTIRARAGHELAGKDVLVRCLQLFCLRLRARGLNVSSAGGAKTWRWVNRCAGHSLLVTSIAAKCAGPLA
ncbi:hypothetical protein ACNKHT_14525 [Shigella flexneri]